MSYYISKDPDYGLVFEDALFYSFGLRMPMPKLIFTEHALPITHYRSQITHYASRNMSHMKHKTVCIVGLGYVGLPLAEAFSKHLKVIGFDVDRAKIEELNKNFFAKQKPLLKIAYAIFCFAKRNISLVKLLKLFKRKVYYDHLLSKEEIEGFGINFRAL